MKLKFCSKFIIYLTVALGVCSAQAGAYEDFFKAIERDDARTVSALLQRGFDPNTRDEEGQVPLYLALRSPSPKVCGLPLLRRASRVKFSVSSDQRRSASPVTRMYQLSSRVRLKCWNVASVPPSRR